MSKFNESSYSIPQEWLEAFNKLNIMGKPKINKAKWLDIHYNAITLFENNWTLNDIFGCHHLTPMTRFDCIGLIMIKNQQEQIVGVSEDMIQLKTRNGTVKSYYKPLVNNERSLIYELG